MKYLISCAYNSKKSYFTAVNIGYLFAIVATIVVMLVFEHGQPALLYLVPGCICFVLLTAWKEGEFNLMWEFDENEFITPEADEDEGKKDK